MTTEKIEFLPRMLPCVVLCTMFFGAYLLIAIFEFIRHR
jgi:hypothetical protein